MPPIKFTQKQIIIIGAIGVLIVVLGILFYVGMRPKVNTGPTVALTVWGTEDQDTMNGILGSYPGGKVTYVQVPAGNYESQLLGALAAGSGPDVFEVTNRSIPRWQSVITPLPAVMAQSFGPLQLAAIYPDVVAQDFTQGGQLYGLPLSIDTLAMVYNKDLFNAAGIAFPPKTWDDFDTDVLKLRAVNAQGQITQAGAVIGGTTATVPNATDLLSLLMLQNGAQMTDDKHAAATFASSNGGAGISAFNFYLQFANAASPYYTWTDNMGSGLDSFTAGKAAIIFLYHSDLAALKAKAPFLNIGIAPMPQPSGATVTINYPKYNGFVVAKASQQVGTAWNLVLYLGTTDSVEQSYLQATGAPPADRAEIQADANNPDLSIFAAQALSARSWYEANDTKIDNILNSAIQSVQVGAADSTRALRQAETAVSQIMSS